MSHVTCESERELNVYNFSEKKHPRIKTKHKCLHFFALQVTLFRGIKRSVYTLNAALRQKHKISVYTFVKKRRFGDFTTFLQLFFTKQHS